MTRSTWLVGVARVAAHPGLWPTAAVEARRLARPGWWHRWPPLPVADRDYLAFRMVTAYGDAAARPSAADLVDYLAWCRRMNELRRQGR